MRTVRALSVLTAIVLVLALSQGRSIAGVASSPHDVTTQVAGKSVCEPCHLPHGAGEDRLWAASKQSGSTGWSTLVVSQLCGSCHYGTPYNASILAHDMTNWAYASGGHGSSTATLNGLNGTDNAASSGLPYGDQSDIQCSSCHNPHEDAVRPFMRVASGSTVQDLCELCHGSRTNTGNSGTANGTAGNDDSMHPNDIAYTVSTTQYDPSLIAATDTNWQALFQNSRGTASAGQISVTNALGGKRIGNETTGNIGCPTCHAVHGDNIGAATGQFDWLLAANNNVAAQNGAALCEACHTGGAGGGTVLVSGTKDHPIDNIVSGRAAATFDFAPWTNAGRTANESVYTLWPKNNSVNQAACTSCHSAHYGVGESPMQRANGDATDWCNSCHTGASKAPAGHHSNQDIWVDSLIVCADCHAGGGTPNTNLTTTTAHRNFVALDLPSAAPVSSDRANFCLKCHAGTAFTRADGGGSVTLGAVTSQTGVYNPTTDGGSVATFPATHGVPRTTGTRASHFLGAISAADNITSPRSAAWGTYGGNSVYSAWGNPSPSTGLKNTHLTAPTIAANDRMICESCHSVRWNAFIDNSTAYATSGMYGNLLLYPFVDDGEGNQGGSGVGANTGSELCVGCHAGGTTAMTSIAASGGLNTYKPAGTHPVTSSTVTKAQDVGRTTTTLITGSGTYADCTTIVPMSYPNTDEMDCDSCHRAHDGAAGSSSSTFNYILEQATSSSNVQSMCVYCHNY